MIPRLHKRGTSFKGASAYLFHDKDKAQTSERVDWVHTENLWSRDPEQAWFEMMQTWQDRDALKQAAGVKRSGRDNVQPVLHLSLSWHEKDRPTEEHMRATAKDALKTLGLQEHQAILVAHRDEEHPHVHLLINTVHPHTGKTASLNYSKETLSRWAEAYQLAHGQEHCPERTKNNARREEIKKERAGAKLAQEFSEQARQEPPKRPAYEPVKDKSPNRSIWIDRAAVVGRMKSLHAEISADQKEMSGTLWRGHQAARESLKAAAEKRVDQAIQRQRDHFKPAWSVLYRSQKTEIRHITKVATHPFERAVFVFRNRDRLGASGKPLSLKQMAALILSPQKLRKTLDATHDRERRVLAQQQKVETKVVTDRLWASHRADYHTLVDRQETERSALRSHYQGERAGVTFERAKEDVHRAVEGAASDFNQAKSAEPPRKETRAERADRIIREMQEIDAKGHKRGDFGREL